MRWPRGAWSRSEVGTYIGAIVPLFVCLIEKGLVTFVILLSFVLLYQLFENYVLNPRVSAHTMDLHPAVAFGPAIVGGSLFGIMGAFLALPAVAIIQAVVSTYVHRFELIDDELLREAGPHERLGRTHPGGRSHDPSAPQGQAGDPSAGDPKAVVP